MGACLWLVGDLCFGFVFGFCGLVFIVWCCIGLVFLVAIGLVRSIALFWYYCAVCILCMSWPWVLVCGSLCLY